MGSRLYQREAMEEWADGGASRQAGRDANFGVGMGRKRRSQSSSQEGNNVRGEMRKRSPLREEESTMKALKIGPMLRIKSGITQPIGLVLLPISYHVDGTAFCSGNGIASADDRLFPPRTQQLWPSVPPYSASFQ